MIKYPYMPSDGKIKYIPASKEFMILAKEYARLNSLDKTMPNASVLVKDGKQVGIGANGSNYHELYGCERVRLNSPTGQDYDKCEGCHPKNHSEQKAIMDALSKLEEAESLTGSEMYLWGHWWCCEACWNAMLNNGIHIVNLLDDSYVLFNKESQSNIIGHQFEDSKSRIEKV